MIEWYFVTLPKMVLFNDNDSKREKEQEKGCGCTTTILALWEFKLLLYNNHNHKKSGKPKWYIEEIIEHSELVLLPIHLHASYSS
jgi:hypothetical protein